MLSPLNPISKVRAGTKEGRGTKEARRHLLGCWERLPGRGKLESEVSLRMVGLGGRGFLAESMVSANALGWTTDAPSCGPQADKEKSVRQSWFIAYKMGI